MIELPVPGVNQEPLFRRDTVGAGDHDPMGSHRTRYEVLAKFPVLVQNRFKNSLLLRAGVANPRDLQIDLRPRYRAIGPIAKRNVELHSIAQTNR